MQKRYYEEVSQLFSAINEMEHHYETADSQQSLIVYKKVKHLLKQFVLAFIHEPNRAVFRVVMLSTRIILKLEAYEKYSSNLNANLRVRRIAPAWLRYVSLQLVKETGTASQ